MEAADFVFYKIIRPHISEGNNIVYLLLLESRVWRLPPYLQETARGRCHQPASNVEKIRSVVLESRYM